MPHEVNWGKQKVTQGSIGVAGKTEIIQDIHLVPVTTASASATLYEGPATNTTKTALAVIGEINQHSGTETFHAGLVCTDGAFVVTGSNVSYVTVTFRQSTL